MELRRFLFELRGRGVYRVAAFYAAGSWALLQVADVAFPILGLPDWAITTLLAAAGMGFPIALALAWLFDLSPEGVSETDAGGITPDSSLLTPARVVEVALLVMLVMLVGFLYMDRLAPGRFGWAEIEDLWQDGRQPAVAVMPFANLSDDPSVEYLGSGLAEEILGLLSRISELDVAARTSSFYYKGRDVDLREVGRKLGVSHVLEGSVRRAEGRVRVTAQLVDTRSGYRLWSETFDRAYDESFTIQDDVARQVVDKLQLVLSDRSQQILQQRPSLNPEAYDYYLRGREYLRRSPSRDSLGSALALFERALALDDSYADAHAGRCDAYLERYRLGLDPADFAAAEEACEKALAMSSGALPVLVALGNLYQASGRLREAEEQFEKALAIEPDAAEALIGLARTYHMDNRPELAEETYARTLRLHPNYWRASISMGSFLFNSGRFDEAIPYYRRVAELVPDDALASADLGAAYYMSGDFERAAETYRHSLALKPTALAYANTGSSLFFLGRYDEALEMYHHAVELAPEDFEHWGALGDAYRHAPPALRDLAGPMYDNAIRLAREHLRINPQDATTLALLAHYQAQRADREGALLALTKARTLAPDDMYVQYNSALALTALGDHPQAVQALGRAVELGYARELIQRDASFRPLRVRRDFKALLNSA